MRKPFVISRMIWLALAIWLPACQDSSFTGTDKAGSLASTATPTTATATPTPTPTTTPSTITAANKTADSSNTQPITVDNIFATSGALCQAKLSVVLVMDVSLSMLNPPGDDQLDVSGILSQIFSGGTGTTSSGTAKTSGTSTTGGGGSQAKIALAIAAAEAFLAKFTNPGDQVGLVEFSTTATVLSPLTTDVSSVVNIVAQMTPQKTTNITAGLQAGYKLFAPVAQDSSYQKFIILMSDGVNNEPGDPVQAATTIKNANVTIFTVGFSNTQGASALQSIASTPSDYINAPDSAAFVNAFNAIATHLCR